MTITGGDSGRSPDPTTAFVKGAPRELVKPNASSVFASQRIEADRNFQMWQNIARELRDGQHIGVLDVASLSMQDIKHIQEVYTKTLVELSSIRSFIAKDLEDLRKKAARAKKDAKGQ